MGNQQSQTNSSSSSSNKEGDKLKSLPQVIDYIATNYILTQNFSDLEKLSNPKYCDKLVVLTSKVIGEKLNAMEIDYLSQRMEYGIEKNIMTKGSIIHLNKDSLTNLDINNQTAKRRHCIGIAKFYVKVAHLFSAIVTTVNPVYSYSENGEKKKTGLLNKKSIPENVETKLTKLGLCSKRINALVNGKDFDKLENNEIVINPSYCSMNKTKDGSTKNLKHEPGIPELEKLYYDNYDFDEGGFKKMSDNMKKIYEKDIETFYKNFTNSDSVPENVKKFSDIDLRAYHKTKGCEKEGAYTKSYSGSINDKLFKEYAEKVKLMINNANTSQDKLLNILDELFVFSFDTVDKKKKIIINPSLNDEGLEKLIGEARTIIIDLYVNCEKDFVECIKIYEAIVESKIIDTTKEQINSLRNMANDNSNGNSNGIGVKAMNRIKATGNGNKANGNGNKATGNGNKATGNGNKANGNGNGVKVNGVKGMNEVNGNGNNGNRLKIPINKLPLLKPNEAPYNRTSSSNNPKMNN